MTATPATPAGMATAQVPLSHAPVPVVDQVADQVDGPAALERLRVLLDPAFLDGVGWDAAIQALTPPADHPQLGFGVCTVAGCQTPTNRADRLCATCIQRYRASGLALDDFTAAGPSKARTFGEFTCAVPGCPRPHEVTTTRLCSTHRWQQQKLGGTLEAFLAHPDVRPLPSLGGCRVACCTRTAATRRRLCRPHQMRWRKHRRAHQPADGGGTGLELGFDDWCRHTPPVIEGHTVVLRGLPELLQVQLLYGLQERSRGGSKTNLPALRRLAERLRHARARSIFDLEPLRLPHLDLLADAVRTAVTRSFSSQETERHKDRWDLWVFGHRGTLDFTAIAQPWLRAAVQVWVGETMPRRRGDGVAGIVRDHIRSVAELAASLRHRPDQGADPSGLARADVVSFLNRLKHLEATGEMSALRRIRTCRRAGQVLRECREFGLTRPGQPLAGLPDDFTIRRDDCPREPETDEPGRALPTSVLRQLCAGLERLEQRCGTTVRTAVELLMDTGRRPDEVCALPWDCLDRDPDGKHMLIYANFKENRLGRRLPIADATARLISAQQQRVRAQFPATPVEELALLPRATRNPRGTHPVKDHHLSETHRRWVDALPPLLLEPEQNGKDGTPPVEFPKAAAVPYAYRHSYAQRHADAGIPIDVLRDLMDHRSLTATQIYYRVTATRTRAAVDRLAAHQFDGHGQRVWRQARALLEHEHQRHAVGQVAVPFGICTEPSNVQAGGGACPFRFRCVGCGHFRTDPSYLPELQGYLDTLLRNRERVRAAVELDDWARAEAMPSDAEITRLRRLIRKVEHDLERLGDTERRQVDEACRVVRATRQTVHLGMPTIRPPDPDPALGTPA